MDGKEELNCNMKEYCTSSMKRCNRCENNKGVLYKDYFEDRVM